MRERSVSPKRRVALVSNLCPYYRRPLFELLARRFDLECFFFESSEPYWNPLLPSSADGEFMEIDLPRRRLFGESLMPALGTRLSRSRYDAVVMGLVGRLMLPYTFATARVRRLPFVLWTGVWSHPQTGFHRATRTLTQSLYRRSDAVVVYGEHVRRALLEVDGVEDTKIFTAGQAVEGSRFSNGGDPTQSRTLLFVGQFEERKGVDDLLTAFSLVDDPTAKLELVGNGSLESTIRDRAARDSRIELIGHVRQEELPARYAAARALVIPSVTTSDFREPWGLVANEAMHAGLPVIATTAVGAAAGGLVRDGVSGLIIWERDPRALGGAMERVLSDDEVTRTLSSGAQAEVAKFTYERMADAFEAAVEFGIRRREPTRRNVAVV